MNKRIKAKQTKKVIPIFFATDDNYMPFLEVSIRSLKNKASKKYNYNIHVLNIGLKEENKNLVKRLEDKGFKIFFDDISSTFEEIKSKLRNIYHFSLATYYRLFIETLYPQYDKVLYLDCDICVNGDVSKLYNNSLKGYKLAGVTDQFVGMVPEFREYVSTVLGVEAEDYINAGIILMNLAEFRKAKIQDTFIDLINTYNFDSVAPDQDYLNYLCRGKIKYLKNGWNKMPLQTKAEGGLNLIHYNLFAKPWQNDDVYYQEYFWDVAKKSPFYKDILKCKADFTEEKRLAKEKANKDIVKRALEICASDVTMRKILG